MKIFPSAPEHNRMCLISQEHVSNVTTTNDFVWKAFSGIEFNFAIAANRREIRLSFFELPVVCRSRTFVVDPDCIKETIKFSFLRVARKYIIGIIFIWFVSTFNAAFRLSAFKREWKEESKFSFAFKVYFFFVYIWTYILFNFNNISRD